MKDKTKIKSLLKEIDCIRWGMAIETQNDPYDDTELTFLRNVLWYMIWGDEANQVDFDENDFADASLELIKEKINEIFNEDEQV